MTTLEPAHHALALISHMDVIAREVRMAHGRYVIMGRGGAKKIAELLHDCFAPGTADSVYQEVVHLLQFN